MTKVTKIFLASSRELADERKEFEIFINRKNKRLMENGAFLRLDIWEDFLGAVSPTRKQDDYNKAIYESDIFVMLFATKVGEYTNEEFDTALKAFKENNRPRIFTYFKHALISTAETSEKRQEIESLWKFLDKLKSLGHFVSHYETTEGLLNNFDEQVMKLAQRGTISLASALPSSSDGLPQPQSAPANNGLVRVYLELMLRSLSFVQIPGLDKTLSLEDLWIRPRFVDSEEGKPHLHRILAKRAVAIEAPTGFGKTTLSRVVAISMAKDFLGQKCDGAASWQQFHLGVKAGDRAQLPILVNLRDLTEFVEIDTLLRGATPAIEPAILPHVRELLEDGRAAVILDGLDEVVPDSRLRVVELITKARIRWSQAYFVITSRHFRAETFAGAEFAMAQMQQLDGDTAEELIVKWSTVLNLDTAARDGLSAAMQKVVEGAGKAQQLVSSPLVVALLAAVYLGSGAIPKTRAGLYSRIAEWLLRSRSKIREREDLDIATTRKTLEGLAFSAVLSATPANRSMEKLTFAAVDRTGIPLATVRRIVSIECEGANCLSDSGNQLVFWHDSLRDYFAACWMVRQFHESEMKISTALMDVLRDMNLREVGEFFVALLAAEGKGAVDSLLRETMPTDTNSLQGIHAAALQTRILGIIKSEGYRLEGLAEKKISKRAIACLDLREETMRAMSIADRVEARVAVGRLGKDSHLYGYPWLRAHPTHAYPEVAIGRYPVTVQEYRRFLEKCACHPGVAGRAASEPYDWSHQLDTPNAPVTGLSWMDATDYCNWLTKEIRKYASRESKLEARLPTLDEWSAMTGDEICKRWPGNIAGMQRSFERRPVGVLFENCGVSGHQDLSDSVWEWIGPSVKTKSRRKQVASCIFDGAINLPFQRRVSGSLRSPLIGFRVAFFSIGSPPP